MVCRIMEFSIASYFIATLTLMTFSTTKLNKIISYITAFSIMLFNIIHTAQ